MSWNTNKIISALLAEKKRALLSHDEEDVVTLDSYDRNDANDAPALFVRVKLKEDNLIDVLSAEFYIDGCTMRTLSFNELHQLEKLLN